MKELLERVAKCMPEGWSLRVFGGWARLVGQEGEPFYDLGDFTDIGLAPLTALLKQEIVGENRGGCFRSANGFFKAEGWFAETGERYVEAYGPNEFEAVANAYLALKENKCN